uniref:Uncharacterized protein n=1 Tax=Rhodosorus marinus TaxID=101924 RepID=A0A7S0BII7_9RHOD|mmetsp:Transcript_15687/g.22962  ORF Transcript_15687/g.22962 Transcript_15687/m.22962 type:complete len:102 (+) Transcript_15687:39-344(+)
MVPATRGSVSEADNRLSDFSLHPVFRGEDDTALYTIETLSLPSRDIPRYERAQGYSRSLGEATEDERRCISAVFARVLEGLAMDVALASSTEAAPKFGLHS